MATNITADMMLAALKKWGITPHFYAADWRTHNRNAVQTWGPINGMVIHNFASDIADTSSSRYLYTGDSARQLPGPLAQFGVDDAGALWVIGWGVANHTKSVDNDTHNLVLKDAAPRNKDLVPNTSGNTPGGWVSGNSHYFGVEMYYGAKGPTAAQLKTTQRLAAAMMDMLGSGYTGGSVIGHRECTTTRSDPQQVPMGAFRAAVDALLKAGASPVPATPSKPSTPPVSVALAPSLRWVIKGETTRLSVTTNAEGTVQFQYFTAGKWNTFATKAIVNGMAYVDSRPGANIQYRAVVAGNVSTTATVKVITRADIAAKFGF